MNWLLAIVADRAHKTYRHRRVQTQLIEVGPACDSPAGVDIARAIGRLTERQRLTVTLYYFLDLPIAEVAQVLRCAEGTVRSTLADARTRTRLRADLGDDYL